MMEKNSNITDLLQRAKEVARCPAGVRSSEIVRKGQLNLAMKDMGTDPVQTATDFLSKQLSQLTWCVDGNADNAE